MTTLHEAAQAALAALEEWAALIQHQFTGTSAAMTDLQYADMHGQAAIEGLKAALAAEPQEPAQPVANLEAVARDMFALHRCEHVFLRFGPNEHAEWNFIEGFLQGARQATPPQPAPQFPPDWPDGPDREPTQTVAAAGGVAMVRLWDVAR